MDHEIVIFLLLLCKIVPLKQDLLITQSIPMDPKYSFIERLQMISYT